MKRGRGINGRDDKSSGIDIRMAEALAKINPTDPLILKNVCPFFFPSTFPPVTHSSFEWVNLSGDGREKMSG
jgi:hypothetical protein